MQIVHSYIWVLWDFLAVGIFFHSVHKCARKGFVSTVIGILIYIAAATAAAKTYTWIAEFLYENVVSDVLHHVLVRSINDMVNGASPAKDVVHALPLILRILIGFKGSALAELQVTDASDMAVQVLDIALKDTIISILHGVGFLFVFAVTAYAVRCIAGFFTRVNRVPVVGTANMVAGGIVGVIEGMLKLFVSGFILRILVSVSGGVWWWLNSAVIQRTYIWRLFYW